MQEYPVRTNIKRAREGNIGNYPDTRRDPVRRMKLERVLEYLGCNKEVYEDILEGDEVTKSMNKIKQETAALSPHKRTFSDKLLRNSPGW